MSNAARMVNYIPGGPTLAAFHRSDEFVRGIMGPLGSGKSTACVIEILRRSMKQKPSSDGIRRTRWAIIRNSYPELKTTTLKTWQQWCPAEYGRLTMDAPIRHHVQTRDLDMEVYFIALDREEDVKKLLSLELTGAWVNEAREIPKAIIDALTGRVGRYPAVNMGGCTWSGIIMDTNPPDDQSGWYACAEEDTPEFWEFFSQPAGDSEDAENLPNLPPNYYRRITAGKDPDWVKVYVKGAYGFLVEGKACYPMYRDRTHCSIERLELIPGIPILIGVDFGLTPAAVLGQKRVNGQWRIFDEVCTDNTGIVRFAEYLYGYVTKTYPGAEVQAGWGDPAGTQKGADERTAFEIMNAKTSAWGKIWKPAPVPDNNLAIRLEVVIGALNRMIDGDPGYLLSPTCKKLRKGFAGGYHYKFIKTGNGAQVHEVPNKNEFSHPHDANQYLLLGGGEHSVVMGRGRKERREAEPRECVGARANPLDPTGEREKRKLPKGWRGGPGGGQRAS